MSYFIIRMSDLPLVGIYTLDGRTYVVLKQTNDSNGDGGELHLGLESFSSLMVLLKGLESELLKNQNPIDSTFNNAAYDPNLLLDGIFKPANVGEGYNPTNESSIMYTPTPIEKLDEPKKQRKRRSDAGVRKKPQWDV